MAPTVFYHIDFREVSKTKVSKNSVRSMATMFRHTCTTSPSHWPNKRSNWGIFAHSACSAAINWGRVRGLGFRFLMRLPSWSHKCSIGDMSGEYAGQGRTLTPCSPRNAMVILAVWGRALSCWKVMTSRCWASRGRSVGLSTWAM